MTSIEKTLSNLFQRYRIVFWYDAKSELRQEFDALSIHGIEKIELSNNEYGVKYRVLRQEPNQRFLLYHEGSQPDDLDNWLLDVQLAHAKFSADQISLWMAELGLRPDHRELVQEHKEFFRAGSRREALKSRLTDEDSHNAIRTKMLAVCVNSDTEARIESILEALFSELAADKDEKISQIKRFNLDTFLWERLQILFGYVSETPGVKDLAIELFKSSYAMALEEEALLTQDALVFLKRWKDSLSHYRAFEILSNQSAEILGIEADLHNRDLRTLVDIDYFSLIDKKILSELTEQVVEQTISAGECANLIWRRRTTHWFDQYACIYEAINYASQFIAELDKADLRMQSLPDGIRKYQNTWYRLDQHYRKFIYNVRKSKQTTLLQNLIELIENLYSNNFLLTVNDNWQQIVDQVKMWDAAPVPSQGDFFEHQVEGYIMKDHKVAILISDALRYEIGEELANLIESEDRYSTELEPMLTMLPSYTQLGMAALLPHREITILEDATVLVDDQKTAGKENRDNILSKAIETGAAALKSDDFLGISREESRVLFRNHAVVYIFHDQIDATGDLLKTEERNLWPRKYMHTGQTSGWFAYAKLSLRIHLRRWSVRQLAQSAR